MKTRITTVAALLLAMFLVGEAFAQVPSSVTQQLRLSTGGATPNYVQHRAMSGAVAPPAGYNAVGGYYAWDQVPAPTVGTNYLLFLNPTNEVRRTSAFGTVASGAAGQPTFLLTVNAAGDNIDYLDPANLIIAQNGLTEPTPNTVELGGTLLHATSIDQDGFGMSFVNNDAVTPTTFTLGGGTGTLNVNIDPGAGGNLNLANIDPLLTAETALFLDGANNVVSRDLDGLVDADNGVTEVYAAGVSTIQLGAPATGGSTLATDRFISLATNDMNWEGTGNFNLGDGASNVTTNINTGATGNLTLQGTLLTPAIPAPVNFLYLDGANVRSATADDIPAGVAATYLAVDATGNVVNAPDPLAGIARGRIAGDGNYIYTVTGGLAANVVAGAAVTATVLNATGAGTISVQVTSVGAGTFTVECAESIQTGSAISWIAINP